MRNYYNQNEIFDIAKIETTFSDGTINKYGTGTLGLLPEYTSDGGHLNQYGRILIAHELLKKLLMDQ
jgi:lysophospholipase L1-like esterase